MSKRKTITFSIVIAIVCFVLYSRPERVLRDERSFAVVTRIDAGSGRSITILLDDTPFEIPGWLYEINVGDQIVVPTTHLSGACRSESTSDYKLLASKDGALVGLVCKERPHILLVVHDFSSGETWPRSLMDDHINDTIERGRSLRDRLQIDHPEPRLILSHDARQSDYWD